MSGDGNRLVYGWNSELTDHIVVHDLTRGQGFDLVPQIPEAEGSASAMNPLISADGSRTVTSLWYRRVIPFPQPPTDWGGLTFTDGWPTDTLLPAHVMLDPDGSWGVGAGGIGEDGRIIAVEVHPIRNWTTPYVSTHRTTP